uniref:Uncharacterized protein n=1 Tax=Triticum urartu TaxID=4572 RepID=A0A8R7PBN1_TRIUA
MSDLWLCPRRQGGTVRAGQLEGNVPFIEKKKAWSFPSSRRQREDARHLLPTFARYDRPFIAATHRVARPRPSLIFHPRRLPVHLEMYGDGVPMENPGRSRSPALLRCAPQVTPTDPRRPPSRTRTTTPRTWSSSTEEGAFVAVVSPVCSTSCTTATS